MGILERIKSAVEGAIPVDDDLDMGNSQRVRNLPESADPDDAVPETEAQSKADAAQSDAEGYADTQVSNHADETQNVHGVGDSDVESESGAQSKADAAQSDAESYADAQVSDHADETATHGVGEVFDADDYDPEADTHDRYEDSEAVAAVDAEVDNVADSVSGLDDAVSGKADNPHGNDQHSTDYLPESDYNEYTDDQAADAAPVQDVEGKTGSVDLNAGDVGAASDNHDNGQHSDEFIVESGYYYPVEDSQPLGFDTLQSSNQIEFTSEETVEIGPYFVEQITIENSGTTSSDASWTVSNGFSSEDDSIGGEIGPGDSVGTSPTEGGGGAVIGIFTFDPQDSEFKVTFEGFGPGVSNDPF